MEDHSATGVHFLNNKMIKNHFLLCSLNNVLLDAVLRHKPVDVNLGGGDVKSVIYIILIIWVNLAITVNSSTHHKNSNGAKECMYIIYIIHYTRCNAFFEINVPI